MIAFFLSRILLANNSLVELFSKNLLLENGYILSNSENIIKNYDETIKVYLIKIDDSLPELKLPTNCLEFTFEKHNYCII